MLTILLQKFDYLFQMFNSQSTALYICILSSYPPYVEYSCIVLCLFIYFVIVTYIIIYLFAFLYINFVLFVHIFVYYSFNLFF